MTTKPCDRKFVGTDQCAKCGVLAHQLLRNERSEWLRAVDQLRKERDEAREHRDRLVTLLHQHLANEEENADESTDRFCEFLRKLESIIAS